MQIHLWHSKGVDQWRWTLSSAKFPKMMESGNSPKLEQAMDDIRLTIEWLLSKDINDYEETNCSPRCPVIGRYDSFDGRSNNT